jgi:DNA topoisomerase VI subunit B
MSNIIGVIYIGAVLSGTKYGLRQTRGKFGLGAKMVNFFLRTQLRRSFLNCMLLWTIVLYLFDS